MSQAAQLNLPSQSLRVAVCELTSTDDVSANVEQIFARLDAIPDPGLVDLVTFPENSLFFRLSKSSSGPLAMDLTEACFKDLHRWVRHHQTEILLGSVPLREEDGSISNATVRISPQTGPEVVYRKIHLFDVEVQGAPPVRESEFFRHGSQPQVLSLKGWQIGLSICYDLRFPELFLTYARQGVHALFVPSAFLVPTGEAHWHVLLRARAIESQCFVLAPAQGGEHRGASGEVRRTYGHSLVVAPWGEILAEVQPGAQPLLLVELNPQKIAQFRRQIPMHEHRRL